MKPKTFNTAPQEGDTYDQITRETKETLDHADIERHWSVRAQRQGVQSVMSARHNQQENEQATLDLQREIFDFLEGHIEDRRIFELGVGIGRMTGELARRAREVVGCDLTPKMIERARTNLKGQTNITLLQGRLIDLTLPPKSFDLVFESIVLLHILAPEEVKKTIEKMRELADEVFLCEHTYEGPDFPISKFSILREPEEYHELLKPYRLVKQKTHLCAGDRFTLMLFAN